METWRILSNYQVHGLAWTVKHETRRVSRRMALIHVRTVLSHSIDNGSFYHAE